MLDMFPYPSGAGLHVGHPLGYIGTDSYARYQRMAGRNVLHAMGFDAFGLPAEQYAVQTGTHPRTTTEQNIERYKVQLRRLGLAHDERRSVATIDTDFYRWTQWIFLQVFNSWYDSDARRARPIAELIAEFEGGNRPTPDGRSWAELSVAERRGVVDDHRLAYVSEAPVNWCPGLGTVLANEEVTADGRSDRGNFPVFKRSLKQWMMRITAYGDRLIEDLDTLDWPEPIKLQQRNWIGRSTGAHIDFPTAGAPVRVFTTRPDTIFGATYMVLAPEHELVDTLVPAAWPAGTKDAWTGGHASPGRPSRRTARRRPPRPTSSGSPTARRRPASSSGRTPPTRSTTRRSRSSSRTTCWPATAPARSWQCPPRMSGTGRSPRSSSCPSCVPCSRRRASTGPRTPATGRRSTAPRPIAAWTWTGWGSPTPRRRSSPGWRRTGTAPAR
ncbi:hypothetical protein GCM10027614_26600 [Micromonospora vulcania]